MRFALIIALAAVVAGCVMGNRTTVQEPLAIVQGTAASDEQLRLGIELVRVLDDGVVLLRVPGRKEVVAVPPGKSIELRPGTELLIKDSNPESQEARGVLSGTVKSGW